jgi:hypothetical protein
MKASSNAFKTDGTSCNVGNTLAARPSVRLLPFGVRRPRTRVLLCTRREVYCTRCASAQR